MAIDSPHSQSDIAYGFLRKAIAEGKYAPGERLRESDIANVVGVSRTPVREAMQRLISDGLLAAGRRGVFISQLPLTEVAALYQVRGALEGLVSELSAERVRAHQVPLADVMQLGVLAGAFDSAAAARDMGRMAAANLALHQHIAELAGNRPALEALSRIWDNVAVSSVANLKDDDWVRRVSEQHRELVNAIAAGDSERATGLARRHIADAADMYTSRSR